MTPNIPKELIDQIKIDEGLRLTAYHDSLGILTIGYGHTPAQEGEIWTEGQATATLMADIDIAAQELADKLPWTSSLDVIRWAVLVNMSFNMGIDRLLGFHNTLSCAEAGDYSGCATNMLQSLWAAQVGDRAVKLAKQMQTGEWQ